MNHEIPMRALLLTLLTIQPAAGDTVVFKAGNRLEGRAEIQESIVRLHVPEGSMDFDRSLVARVQRGRTSRDEYELARARLNASDAAGHYQLGLFAEARGLPKQAEDSFQATLAADPQHPGARGKLHVGQVYFDGAWMTPEAARKLALLSGRVSQLEGTLSQTQGQNSLLRTQLDDELRQRAFGAPVIVVPPITQTELPSLYAPGAPERNSATRPLFW